MNIDAARSLGELLMRGAEVEKTTRDSVTLRFAVRQDRESFTTLLALSRANGSGTADSSGVR